MADLMARVEDLLTPYLGVAASVADHRHFVVAALEHFCYGTPMPENGDLGYHLPSAVMEKIYQGVNQLIYHGIHASLGMIWPARFYGFTVIDNDILVEEALEPRTVPVPLSPVGKLEEEDGYIPERLRRQAR